jgi:hypothetical protein
MGYTMNAIDAVIVCSAVARGFFSTFSLPSPIRPANFPAKRAWVWAGTGWRMYGPGAEVNNLLAPILQSAMSDASLTQFRSARI